MTPQKKQWLRPQLIVLARGTPQENVLTSCKTKNPNVPEVTGPNPVNAQDRCSEGVTPNNCSVCQARAQADT